MTIRFIGANPGITISQNGDRVAYASVWRADWSEQGTGRAIVLWHNGMTRVASTSSVLGDWLAGTFTRHFPEVAGLPWPDPKIIETEVALDLDLTAGMTAHGGGIEVAIGPPTDRRLFTTDAFDLGGALHELSTVFMPCGTGSITVDGIRIVGEPKAFIADAEVWSR
jgi:hypothetical protein